MSFLGIALNDAGIAAVGDAGVVYAEPGCALLADKGVVYGREALSAARTRPGAFNDRFWHEMSEKPLVGAQGELETHADLAYGQLNELWTRCGEGVQSVGLAVPSAWDREQLALLLGLAQEAAIPVAGLAELSVAATRRTYPDQELFSVEAGTYQVGICRMQADTATREGTAEIVNDVGIARLRRACAEYFARAFLDGSRFDPMHDAASEQALYDRLADWLEQLRKHDGIHVVLEHGGADYSAEVSSAGLADALRAAAQPLIQSLRSLVSIDRPTALQINAELAAYPGIGAALETLPECIVYELEPAAAARGLFVRQRSLTRSDAGYSLTSGLPLDQSAAARPATAGTAVNGAMPTHLLHEHTAYRLGDQPLRIGLETAADDYGIAVAATHAGVSRQHCTVELVDGRMRLSDHSRFGTELNGRPVQDSAVLQPGDVISIGRPPCRFSLLSEELPGEDDGT